MSDEFAMNGLALADDDVKRDLGRILWCWDFCGTCSTSHPCGLANCSCGRIQRLAGFWKRYENVTDAYCPEQLGRRPALHTHADLHDAIKQIKDHQAMARGSMLQHIFEDRAMDGEKPPTTTDQNRAFNIAASVVFLMDFGVLHDAANSSEGNVPRYAWRDAVSGCDFIAEAFPTMSEPSLIQDVVSSLTATNLRKVGKLRLEATGDIRRHLVLDVEERVVWVFHQESVLRECLEATEVDAHQTVLPRALLLEVLDTLHDVLFPSDPGSFNLLQTLVSKHGFDAGLQTNGSTPYRTDSDPPVTYAYFGPRLAALHQELRTPTPHGWLQRRLQRKSETYMLMATLIGVCIAVTLGLLGLIVSMFQAWVSYQQWKHPVRA